MTLWARQRSDGGIVGTHYVCDRIFFATRCVCAYLNTLFTLQETLPITMPGSKSFHFIDDAG